MPDSLEDSRKAVAAEIVNLEKQISDILAEHGGLLSAGNPIPPDGPYSQKTLDEAFKKLNNRRQEQLSYLLASITESSNRLEAATRNLQQSSEAQVKVSKSQADSISNLLRSSYRLEQFALFLIALTALSVFVVEQSIAPSDPTLKTVWLVLGIVSIVALAILAFRWPLIRKGKLKSA